MVRLRVFISSTHDDLVTYRARVAEAVERLSQQGVRMETFGARAADAAAASLEEVDDCDLFVGIYAHRYGYVPPGSTVSITNMEFDRAQQRHKPTLCFVVDPEYSWPPKHVEADPGQTKLDAFKKELGAGLVRDTFTTPDDLAFKVAASLGRYLLRDLPNAGGELQRFCQSVAGCWWSIGADPDSVGFVRFAPDEGARTLTMSGRTFDPNGNVLAVWESAASCVYLGRSKLYYYWQGWWPRAPHESHEGFGEVSFQGTAGRIDAAVGVFYDSNLTSVENTRKKASRFWRCDEHEIEVMQGVGKDAICALLQSKVSPK